jgi:hypothetical protein
LAPRQQRGANGSDLSILCEGKSILHVNSEVSDRILDLAMAEEDLDGAQVAGRPVDDRRLRSAKRMGANFTSHQANSRHPLIDKPGILPGAEVTIVIYSAWEDVLVHRAATPLKPGQQTGPGIGK